MDIRGYFVTGGHKPIDRSLVDRTVAMVRRALAMVDNASNILEGAGDGTGDGGILKGSDGNAVTETPSNSTYPRAEGGEQYLGVLLKMETKGDILSGPIILSSGVNHILGPLKSTQAADCHSMVLRAVRDVVGSTEDHCVDCGSRRRCLKGESWREWDREIVGEGGE